MRFSLAKQVGSVFMASVGALVCSSPVVAEPFSAEYTSRESKRITSILSTAPFTRTYSALTQDSQDLTFYESTTGKLFIAFASKDYALDDLGTNECGVSSYYQVYWADRTKNLPAVCLSTGLLGGAGTLGDSVQPLIAGSGDDEGRYIAYETDATNVLLFVPTETPTPIPATPPAQTPAVVPPRTVAQHQVVFHDRKWGSNIPSCSKCDVGSWSVQDGSVNRTFKACNGAKEPLKLWQMSDNGRDLLLSTSSFNMRDNRTPNCEGNSNVENMYIRNGSDCVANAPGACYTSVIDDNTGYQIFDPSYETLDATAENLQMTPDGSIVVFDTTATNPMHFTPDVGGFSDIYRHTNLRFTRISEAMVPFCSTAGEVLPLTNEFGPANEHSARPTVDSTGRFISFESNATDLVVWAENPAMICSTPGAPHPADIQYLDTNGHKQIYLYDHLNKRIDMISTKYRSSSSVRKQGGNGDSNNARISRDGRFIVFESESTDLLETATTSKKNIFAYDTYLKRTFLVTTGTSGAGLDQDADLTHISHSGLTVGFKTKATDVVIEGPLQGTAVGGTVQLAAGGTETDDYHVYIARHNCPLDTDGDLVPDCSSLDSCPNDRDKTEPKVCGCGTPDTDTDKDLTPDCVDKCPSDPNKIAVGSCGCGKADTDSDFDGTPDCVDACPKDPGKIKAGVCGCGVSDVDTDLDGSADCQDSCPTDPAKTGATGCACGSLKDVPGECGCNVVDVDNNGNGVADCNDPTSSTVPSAAAYVTTQLNLPKSKVLNILRIRMQNFKGKVTYSYTITGKGTKISRTSTSSTISYNGLKAGSYKFSYFITTGVGAGKVTTKTSTTTLKIN